MVCEYIDREYCDVVLGSCLNNEVLNVNSIFQCIKCINNNIKKINIVRKKKFIEIYV